MREYAVKRHSGRNSDDWREVLRTTDQQRAEARFAKLSEAMRQGGVMLVRYDGDGSHARLAARVAPRVRTRW